MKNSRFFFTVVVSAAMVFQACEKENIPRVSTPTLVSGKRTDSVVLDTRVFSDSVLLAILSEEKQLMRDIKAGRIVDVSGMHIEKQNPKKVYAHYMPWFQSQNYDGYWGQHWTMTNRNPNVMDSSGTREIASHFYPLIGPYSSADPDLQEYHFLLMKQCGIDGVIFDWYGARDFYDYGLIKQSTETFMVRLDDLDMDFSIMYEDRVAQQAVAMGFAPDPVSAVQDDFRYMRDTYFIKDNFLTHNGNEMVFVFGPEHVIDSLEWNTIFDVFPSGASPDLLTLWAAQGRVGANASGEFLWIAPDHLLAHDHYYANYFQGSDITFGSVYPGFEDYYQEGGWGNPHQWGISDNGGNTFLETLNYTHLEGADFIQLATWNDFGEGTMIEPTEEHGFLYLQLLQEYTGVNATPQDLQTTLDLYRSRKQFQGNARAQQFLDRSYHYIKNANTIRAKQIVVAVDRFM